MNAVVAQTNKMLTWQEIFAQAARQPFARLASYTSESQERMTRNVYPAVWAIERFVDKSLANPKVAVVGATIAAMSFDAMLLPVFNRLCRQGITWTISAPAAPKPGRAKFNELNLVKKPTVLRQDTPAALDKISDTADVLMIHSTLGLEQAREIVDHPAFNQYTQDGKYLLWGADTELGLGIIGRWLNARGYTTSQSVRGPFERADSQRMPNGLIHWMRIGRQRTAVSQMAPSKADAEARHITSLWRAMQRAVPEEHQLEVAYCIGTVCEQQVQGRAIRALMASPCHLVDLGSGGFYDRSTTQDWTQKTGKLPSNALALFPEEDIGDPVELRVRRMSWLQRAMEEYPPQAPAPKHTEQPDPIAREDAQAKEIQPPQEHKVPAPKKVRVVRGKGTWPVLAVNARIGQPKADPQDSVQMAATIVCAWLAERKKIRVDASLTTFTVDSASEEVTIEADGTRLWAMRLDDRRGMTEGAFWRVEMILAAQPHAQIAIRIEQIRLNASAPVPQPAVPAFVIDLADKLGLHDGGRLLRSTPWEIIGTSDAAAIVKELMDAAREHPVLVVSHAKLGERMQNIAQILARRLAGVATVAWLDNEMVATIKTRMGASLAVYGDAVRLYQPGLSRTDNPFTHPLFPAGQETLGDERLVDLIAQEACAWAIEPSNLDAAVPTFAEARRSIIARRVSDALDATQRSAQSAQETIERLQKLVAEQDVSLKTSEAQLRERTQEAVDLRVEIDVLTRERNEAIDELRRERHKSAYQWTEQPRDDASNAQEPEWPERWDDLESWVEVYGQGRMLLHPKAVKAASNSPFNDIPFAYKVLHLLVDAYIPMKTRAANDEQPRLYFEERCKQLGVDVSPVGAAIDHQRYANRYRRKFEDKVLTMDMHVSRGGGMDPATVFRCYFTYDADNERVLVGHLPTHLDNSLTHTS